MQESFNDFIKGLEKNTIWLLNKKLNKIIKSNKYMFISENFDFNTSLELFYNFNASKVIIINQYAIKKESLIENFFIIGFEKTIIIINQSYQSLLQMIFNNNLNPKIYFLNNSKEIFDETIKIKYELSNNELLNNEDIKNFFDLLSISKDLNPIKDIILVIMQSSFHYLLAKSYEKLNKNRFTEFALNKHKYHPIDIEESDYIELKLISNGSSFIAELIYFIEKEELLLLKKLYSNFSQDKNLLRREEKNYLEIQHTLIPRYYGVIESNNYLVIEFINGETLSKIKNMKLNENEKITIIFELILVLEYLHSFHFVYRDLKPNNIIIDQNKTAILIDFDRMIKLDDIYSDQNFTCDFNSSFVAPEVNLGNISYKNDTGAANQYATLGRTICNQSKSLTF